MKPPGPDTLPRQQPPDTHSYARALEQATEVEECRSWTPEHGYVTYCWMLWPSRNTWPTWHENRPAPSPGCGCKACARPFCCGRWREPVTISTGETVAWLCVRCDTSTPDPAWLDLGDRPSLSCRHEHVRLSLCLDCGSALT